MTPWGDVMMCCAEFAVASSSSTIRMMIPARVLVNMP